MASTSTGSTSASMDPVGYKRVNKKTGKEIAREQIVKGVEYEDGQYVVLSDEEIAAAYPKTTQTIEIEAFVAGRQHSLRLPRAALLRGADQPRRQGLRAAARDAAAQRPRRHRARRDPDQAAPGRAGARPGPALVLNLLRWGADIRPWKDLPLPSESAKKAGLTERELKMAEAARRRHERRLGPGRLQGFVQGRDHAAGRREGQGRPDRRSDASPSRWKKRDKGGAKILDLTELLQRSLRKGGKGPKPGGQAKKRRPQARTRQDGRTPQGRLRQRDVARPSAREALAPTTASAISSRRRSRAPAARRRRAARCPSSSRSTRRAVCTTTSGSSSTAR